MRRGKGTREPGSKGARKQGSEGAREQREQGSETNIRRILFSIHRCRNLSVKKHEFQRF